MDFKIYIYIYEGTGGLWTLEHLICLKINFNTAAQTAHTAVKRWQVRRRRDVHYVINAPKAADVMNQGTSSEDSYINMGSRDELPELAEVENFYSQHDATAAAPHDVTTPPISGEWARRLSSCLLGPSILARCRCFACVCCHGTALYIPF